LELGSRGLPTTTEPLLLLMPPPNCLAYWPRAGFRMTCASRRGERDARRLECKDDAREKVRDHASCTSPSVHKHDDGERKTGYDALGDGRRRVQHCCSHGRATRNPDWTGSALRCALCLDSVRHPSREAQRPGSLGAWAWAWSGVTHVSSAGAVSLTRSRDHGAGRWRWWLFLLLLLSQCLHS